jgi:predicted enzyme related to lactoylglutathione lyase
MLKRVNFVAIPVKDQGRALEFYTKKVGLKVFTDQTVGPMRWIELQVPGAETMVVLHHKPGHEPSGEDPAVAFLADSVQGTYEEMRAKGVEFVQPPKKEHWGEHAIFVDSEGNRILFAKG